MPCSRLVFWFGTSNLVWDSKAQSLRRVWPENFMGVRVTRVGIMLVVVGQGVEIRSAFPVLPTLEPWGSCCRRVSVGQGDRTVRVSAGAPGARHCERHEFGPCNTHPREALATGVWEVGVGRIRQGFMSVVVCLSCNPDSGGWVTRPQWSILIGFDKTTMWLT
jgi:hypothetical protein